MQRSVCTQLARLLDTGIDIGNAEYLPTGRPAVHGTFSFDWLLHWFEVLTRFDGMLDVGVGVLGERAWFFGFGAESCSRIVRTLVTPAHGNVDTTCRTLHLLQNK